MLSKSDNSSQIFDRPHFRVGNYKEVIELMAKKGQLVEFIKEQALAEKRALCELVSEIE
jgi:hypothetical protein